jgi:hypothetical protein
MSRFSLREDIPPPLPDDDEEEDEPLPKEISQKFSIQKYLLITTKNS